MIAAMSLELGAEAVDYGVVKDDLDAIASAIKKALEVNDAVFTTGGTSVGGLDLVPDAVNKLGKPGVLVHGMAMRPGMPAALAVVDKKPVLILSGNPVAAVFEFEAFARPLICRMLGMPKVESRPVLKAKLTGNITAVSGRRTYIRVRVINKEGELVAVPVSAKGAGSISTMTQSNGYILALGDREVLNADELVFVHMFGAVEDT